MQSRCKGVRRWPLLGLLLMNLVGCAEQDRESLFAELPAPAGHYTLIATVVEPWFPQGPHQVLIYVAREQSAKVEVARSALAYDGVPFTERNIGMRWVSDDEALVCLRATDRPDRSIHVNVRHDPPQGALRDGC